MIVTDSPAENDVKFLYDQLNAYNDGNRVKDGKKIAIYVKSNEGAIVAGLVGISFLNWLHVDVLWVDEHERGKNIGGQMLERAEQVAIGRGCIGVNLETYSYQAPSFYFKKGYVEFGRLDGYGGHSRHYLKKMLQPGN